ncbi:hypothetical protein FHG87_004648 [Trinorchestia longiramus]|nr:hypothetical protein FHG87_004648 [Trinorchestia longiramus]
MFPAALWDVQAESSSKTSLGRGVKWQRMEEVPDADQEAVVRYVIKDKLVGKPITKRLDGITHGKVVFFYPSPAASGASVPEALARYSSETSSGKKKNAGGNILKTKYGNEEHLPCSSAVGSSSVYSLVQVMVEFNGIKRGLDTMWQHMGVETNIGLCLHPEEAMFLMQAGEFRAVSSNLRLLSVQHLQALTRSPYCLFRAYSRLCGSALRAVRHHPHVGVTGTLLSWASQVRCCRERHRYVAVVGVTEYERKIKLDQHDCFLKATGKKENQKKKLEAPKNVTTDTVSLNVEDPALSLACKVEAVEDDLDKEMMAFYNSLENQAVADTTLKREEVEADEFDLKQNEPNSFSKAIVDIEIDEKWLLEYEESKREILKNVASMNPNNGLCVIKKTDNFLPCSLKVLEDDYVLWATDLIKPGNVRPRTGTKGTEFNRGRAPNEHNFNYYNWSNPSNVTEFSDGEGSGPLDSDIETSSSSDSESVSSLSESDSEDVSYQGWYVHWDSPVYMKRVVCGDDEQLRSSIKRSLSLSEDSKTEDEEEEKPFKVARIKEPPLDLVEEHGHLVTSAEEEIGALQLHSKQEIQLKSSGLNDTSKTSTQVDSQSNRDPECRENDQMKNSPEVPMPCAVENEDVSSSDSDSTSSSSSSCYSDNSSKSKSSPTRETLHSSFADVDMRPKMTEKTTESGLSSVAENFLKSLGESLEKTGCVPSLSANATSSQPPEFDGTLQNGTCAKEVVSCSEFEVQDDDAAQLEKGVSSPIFVQEEYPLEKDISVDTTINSVLSLIESVKNKSLGSQNSNKTFSDETPPISVTDSHAGGSSEIPNDRSESSVFKQQSSVFTMIPRNLSSTMNNKPTSRNSNPYLTSDANKVPEGRMSECHLVRPNGVTEESSKGTSVRLTRTMINNSWRLRVKTKRKDPDGARVISAVPSLADRLNCEKGEEEDDDLRSTLSKKKILGDNTIHKFSSGLQNPSHVRVTVENTSAIPLSKRRNRRKRRLSRRAKNVLKRTNASLNTATTNVINTAPNGLLRVNIVNDHRKALRTSVRDRLDGDDGLVAAVCKTSSQLRGSTSHLADSSRRLEISNDDIYENRQICKEFSGRCDSSAFRNLPIDLIPLDSQKFSSVPSVYHKQILVNHSDPKENDLPDSLVNSVELNSYQEKNCSPLVKEKYSNSDLRNCPLAKNIAFQSSAINGCLSGSVHQKCENLNNSTQERGNTETANQGRTNFVISNRDHEEYFSDQEMANRDSFNHKHVNHDFTNRGRKYHDFSNPGRGGHDFSNPGRGGHDFSNPGRGGHDFSNPGRGHHGSLDFTNRRHKGDDFTNRGYGDPDFNGSYENLPSFSSERKNLSSNYKETHSAPDCNPVQSSSGSHGEWGFGGRFYDNEAQNFTFGSRGTANLGTENCGISSKSPRVTNESNACAMAYRHSLDWRNNMPKETNFCWPDEKNFDGFRYGDAHGNRYCENENVNGRYKESYYNRNRFEFYGNGVFTVDETENNAENCKLDRSNNPDLSRHDNAYRNNLREYSEFRAYDTSLSSRTNCPGNSVDNNYLNMDINNRNFMCPGAMRRGSAKQWQRLQRQKYKDVFRAQQSVLDQRVVGRVSSWRQYREAVQALQHEGRRDAPSSRVLVKGCTVPMLGPTTLPANRSSPSYDEALASIKHTKSFPLLSEWLQQQELHAKSGSTKVLSSLKATYDVYMAKSGYSRSRQTIPDLRTVVPRLGDEFNLLSVIALRRHHADSAELTLATNAAVAVRPRHINFPGLLGGSLGGCNTTTEDEGSEKITEPNVSGTHTYHFGVNVLKQKLKNVCALYGARTARRTWQGVKEIEEFTLRVSSDTRDTVRLAAETCITKRSLSGGGQLPAYATI